MKSLIVSPFKSKKAGIVFILIGLFIPVVLYQHITPKEDNYCYGFISGKHKIERSELVLRKGIYIYESNECFRRIAIPYKHFVSFGIVLVFAGVGIITLNGKRLLADSPEDTISSPVPRENVKSSKKVKINLKDHLEKLVKERLELQKKDPYVESLRQCLALLGNELLDLYSPKYNPRDIAKLIEERLENLMEKQELEERLNNPESESRTYDLWELLMDYHTDLPE